MIATGGIPSILLVDDDRALCALMSAFLEPYDFRLTAAYDGPTGLLQALEGRNDLIILDWMLPGFDGIEVLKRLRDKSITPVIMLTARRMRRDRIAGLDAGADDYLPKPFGPQELLARIRAVLRRTEGPLAPAARSTEVGHLRLDHETCGVWNDSKWVELTSIEIDILQLLILSAGKVVSRDAIATVLYRRTLTPFERAIDVHICHLRQKLESDGRPLIRTIRGIGYMLVMSQS